MHVRACYYIGRHQVRVPVVATFFGALPLAGVVFCSIPGHAFLFEGCFFMLCRTQAWKRTCRSPPWRTGCMQLDQNKSPYPIGMVSQGPFQHACTRARHTSIEFQNHHVSCFRCRCCLTSVSISFIFVARCFCRLHSSRLTILGCVRILLCTVRQGLLDDTVVISKKWRWN